MKAISIKQPFPFYIALGKKKIETRTWATNYRGPLLVCSAKEDYQGNLIVKSGGKYGLVPAQFQMSMSAFFKICESGERGKAICVVDLVDCRPMKSASMFGQKVSQDEIDAKVQYFPGAFAWVFENPRKIEKPFPVKGKLGLFEVDDSLIPDYIIKIIEK